MTKKEIKKFNIIQGCIDGLYTVPQAAEKLEISERQVQRLKKEVKLNANRDGLIGTLFFSFNGVYLPYRCP